jgi:mono/diheme cytochrome c family protein
VKAAANLALAAAAAACAAVLILRLAFPRSRPALSIAVEATPARLARGRYLFWNVAMCANCHSGRDESRYGMPVVAATAGGGGMLFDSRMGVPGEVFAGNITPDRDTGIGAWTDGEILRTLREGVDRTGSPLFPIMPYHNYQRMGDEDAYSLVSYLRTLRPLARASSARHLAFPGSLLFRVAPHPVDGAIIAPDDARNHLAYGKYVTTIASCGDCHTPRNALGFLDERRALSGGWEMRGPWGRVVASNITPATGTFVGRASRAEFVGRFQSFAAIAARPPRAGPGRNTVMPWLAYSGMTEQDLGAIYDYLRTVPPIVNRVEPLR